MVEKRSMVFSAAVFAERQTEMDFIREKVFVLVVEGECSSSRHPLVSLSKVAPLTSTVSISHQREIAWCTTGALRSRGEHS